MAELCIALLELENLLLDTFYEKHDLARRHGKMNLGQRSSGGIAERLNGVDAGDEGVVASG